MPKQASQDRVRIAELIAVIRGQNRGDIPTDVLGSYTGLSRDGDRPVQDADDL